MPTLSAIIHDSRLTLSELERRSGVSRTTLSRIVNGHQALSRRTAEKLARVLEVAPKELMRTPSTRPAAPEVLRISALQVQQWGESRIAEGELPALVKRLIRSELFIADGIRAPSDERIVERGPDIAVSTGLRTRHIPAGRSVWEVSTENNPSRKAGKDLKRRRVPSGWQRDTTSFVFVTTEFWAGGNDWAYQHMKDAANEDRWKSIKVLDASDLQSWTEEWVGVQMWLMDRMGVVRDGFRWLKADVEEWGAVAKPAVTTNLLESNVKRYFSRWHEWLSQTPSSPFTITGESHGEARLLVQALLEKEARTPPKRPIEGLCVDTDEALRRLLDAPTDDVVVVPMNSKVRELAITHSRTLRVALPTTGTLQVVDPVTVSPPGFSAVEQHLVANGTDSGRAAQIARACGGSVTVLRRLTRVAPEEPVPVHIDNRQLRTLAAAGLFGMWDAGSKADRDIVQKLTGQRDHDDVEDIWTELLNMPEPAVWMDGDRRGVNSRLDSWQRFTERHATPRMLERFFSAIDTALEQARVDAPPQRLLLPSEYKAARDAQVSSELLRGLMQSLVLLAEFGDTVDARLVGARVARRVDATVTKALQGLTRDRLMALREVLPLLAEAAPRAFLASMKDDLGERDSAQRALLNFRWEDRASRPALQLVHDTDALRYRSALMRAYSTLAWFQDHVEPAIGLLAELANEEIHDHHGGQPRQILAELLKPWHRGSMLDCDRHCAVLRKLAENHPDWAIELIRECLPSEYDTTHTANLPLWRGDPQDANTRRPPEHEAAVHRTAAELLVKHAGTTEGTVYSVLSAIDRLEEELAEAAWESISKWACSECRSAEERTRVARRLTVFADGTLSHVHKEENRESAHRLVAELLAGDVATPAVWLFEPGATMQEHEVGEPWEVTEERLRDKRRAALEHVRASGGVEAVVSLVHEVKEPYIVGAVASHILTTSEVHTAVKDAMTAGGDSPHAPMRWFVQGLLHEIDETEAQALLEAVGETMFARQDAHWRPCVLARLPFTVGMASADKLSAEELEVYWQQLDSVRDVIPAERKDWLIAGLCAVQRPRAALLALSGNFDGVRTESLRKLVDCLPVSDEPATLVWDKELVTAIRKRTDLNPGEAARIEFVFFELLERDGMPALAEAVASDPAWLKEALMLCTPRDDDGQDAQEWTARQQEVPDWLRRRARRLFDWLPRLPGTTPNGYDAKQGLTWFNSILAFAEQHGRREIAEILLGNTLGTAGFHDDGAPTDQLTELLELVGSPRIEESVANTVGNALGAVRLPRGDAGRPYRDRVEFYRELEVRYRDSAPRTTRVMDLLRHRFEDQARLADDQDRLNNRRDAHD